MENKKWFLGMAAEEFQSISPKKGNQEGIQKGDLTIGLSLDACLHDLVPLKP